MSRNRNGDEAGELADSFMDALNSARQPLQDLLNTIGYNDNLRENDRADSPLQYHIANDTICQFENGPQLLKARYHADRPWAPWHRHAKRVWSRIDADLQGLVSFIRRSREALSLDEEEDQLNPGYMSRGDARDFCIRGQNILGRVNIIASQFDEFRRAKRASERNRLRARQEDRETVRVWANSIATVISPILAVVAGAAGVPNVAAAPQTAQPQAAAPTPPAVAPQTAEPQAGATTPPGP
jgi:hypothetical protein